MQDLSSSSTSGTSSSSTSTTFASESTARYFHTPSLPFVGSGSGIGVSSHFDDISARCVRALVCSETEWNIAQPASNLGGVAVPLSEETERKITALLGCICEGELLAKPTTIKQDEELLEKKQSRSKGFGGAAAVVASSDEMPERLRSAIIFRMEKKKLLEEAIRLS